MYNFVPCTYMLTFIGEAVGEEFCHSGERWTIGGISEEVCDAIHALHGVPHPPTDSSAWQSPTVFWARYVQSL